MTSDIVNQVNFTKSQGVDSTVSSQNTSRNEPQAVTGGDKSSSDNSEVSKADLQQAVNDMKSRAQDIHVNMTFSVDKDLGRTVIKVINTDTHEVIRQIPSKEFLEIAKALDKTHSLLMKIEA